MGSTGSVVFGKKYQLIGSLYNGNDRKDNEFGYTLVRHPLNQMIPTLKPGMSLLNLIKIPFSIWKMLILV